MKTAPDSIVEVFTGMRPTGDLTVANYLGAIEPIIKLQESGQRPVLFVADLHAITDKEPKVAMQFTQEVVADYLALGIDPTKSRIFVQSSIGKEIAILMAFLARHVSVAELLRVPTLKDKLKANSNLETANALLLLYPVMMAADILLQRARSVPVGEDQVSHMEIARLLARRFNDRYEDVFPIPQVLQVKSLRILGLRGEGKMSKTSPDDAIFLTDSHEDVARKIKKAETAVGGLLTDRLQSHILVAKGLSKDVADCDRIEELIAEHLKGGAVMGEFKKIFTRVSQSFLAEFQERKAKVVKDSSFVPSILKEGEEFARSNALETLALVEHAMFN